MTDIPRRRDETITFGELMSWLKDAGEKCTSDTKVIWTGCYGATGDLLFIEYQEDNNTLNLGTDVCSG